MNIIYLFLIFSFSFLKADSVDLYYALKEKDKIEYLNKITKIYLNSVKNSSISGNNLLNTRNSSLEKIVSLDLPMDARDITVIRLMEKISYDLIYRNISINCVSIKESPMNDINITYDECFDLDRRIRPIYKVGVYNIEAFDTSFINYNNVINTINANDINSSEFFFNKIKNDKINDIHIEEKIKYMSIPSLVKLCNKITNTSNKSFIPRENIMKAIVTRATILGNTAAVNLCTAAYDFSDYTYDKNGINVIPNPVGGELSSLMAQIAIIQSQIIVLNVQITNAHEEYIDLFNSWFVMTPGVLKTLAGIAVTEKDDVWQDLLSQKDTKEATIVLLQDRIDNL